MSQRFYSINAYSKAKNQLQREFSQDELEGRPITNVKQAEQLAESFAQRLNQQAFLGVQDWRAKLEVIANSNVYRK